MPQVNCFATVVLANNLTKELDYAIPEEMQQQALLGMQVEVPLKNRLLKAFIVKVHNTPAVANARPLHKILSKEELITSELFELSRWMAAYYCTPLSKVIKTILPANVRHNKKPQQQLLISLTKSKAESLSICQSLQQKHPSRALVLSLLLKAKGGMLLSEMLHRLQISRSPIDTLTAQKIIKTEKIETEPDSLLMEEEFFLTRPKKLNKEQKAALEKILNGSGHKTHLLFGVTGSGKTEIYLQAIEEVLKEGKSIIMLVPEITLTPQTIERFRARFQDKIAVLHHRKTDKERFLAWRGIKEGRYQIIIGARSAIFAPAKNLGLIIVDEEHDSSYKQSEEQPTYHARNIAVMRGKIANCPVVLGTATPAIESYYNALSGKYQLSMLTKRPQGAVFPEVTVVDMGREAQKAGGYTYFSERLLDGIKSRFEKGEQTLLFLNRRGYSSFLLCQACSQVVRCPHCDLSLAFHKSENLLSCHSCGYSMQPPRACPTCKSSDQIKYKGFGTEQIEKSLKAIFPFLRVMRIDRDTTSHKESHDSLFQEFRCGKADVLVGTQMIVKGLHFPCVTLVGVLNSDGALNIPDFRAAENVFSLITQVSGRAGREQLKGEVIIQTYQSAHPIIKLAAKADYLSFYQREVAAREIFAYPPFSHLARFIFSSEDETRAKNWAQVFYKHMVGALSQNYSIHPVVPCGHTKIKDKYRFMFLCKGPSAAFIARAGAKIKHEIVLPASVKMLIDIDPISTFF